MIIIHVRRLIALLIATHEPPSKHVQVSEDMGIWDLGVRQKYSII